MTKTADDLRGLIYSMKQGAGAKKTEAVPSRRKWDLATLVLVPISIGTVGGVAGFLLSGRGLMLLVPAVALSTLAAFFLLVFWKKLGMGYGESDVVVELLRRKTVEMERDRFVKGLEESHRLLQAATEKQLLAQDELARERAVREEMIAAREQKNKQGFELEKEKLLALLKSEEQKRIDLERGIAEREIAWAGKFEEFETHLREGTLKDLEGQYDKSRAEIVREQYAKLESLKKEGEDRQRTLEESVKAEMRNRDRNIDELNRRIADLQSAADVKAIADADKMTELIRSPCGGWLLP